MPTAQQLTVILSTLCNLTFLLAKQAIECSDFV